MEKLVATLGIDRPSKSQVSVMAKDLDAQVEAFRTRRWTPAPTRSWPPTRWCSRCARADARSTSTPCSPLRSTQPRYPTIVNLWRSHWAEFVPFLAFPPEVRRVIYTTNLIESMNARLRKVTATAASSPASRPR